MAMGLDAFVASSVEQRDTSARLCHHARPPTPPRLCTHDARATSSGVDTIWGREPRGAPLASSHARSSRTWLRRVTVCTGRSAIGPSLCGHHHPHHRSRGAAPAPAGAIPLVTLLSDPELTARWSGWSQSDVGIVLVRGALRRSHEESFRDARRRASRIFFHRRLRFHQHV